ncbi:DUF6599 family protein [Gemmatimonadota bacterium]
MRRCHSLAEYFTTFIPILLCLLAVSCSRRQDDNQAAGQNTSAAAQDVNNQAANLKSLLPTAQEAGEWQLTGEPRIFLPENLWEYINGGAEGYLVYNFEAVVTADYEVAMGGTQAVVDIYRMGNQLCGFGIYSAERNSFAPRVDIGSEGYVTDNALHFWQGPYYVKITAFETGKAGQLEQLARGIGAKLDAPAGDPPQLAAFPERGQVAGSQRYMAQDVLGHSELKNGFSADYELGGEEFKLFLILHDDPAQASHSFEVYREFMEQYSQGVEDGGVDFPLFTAQDSYYGKVVAMQSGRALLVTLGLNDPELVNEYLRKLTDNLSSQGMV